jgi:Ca2+-binding RTX toxin-like protein
MPITSANAKSCAGTIPSGTGAVCASTPAPGSQDITFTGIANVTGTEFGGDSFFAGSGTESLTENGAAGTLDYSEVPLATGGIAVEADATSAVPGEPGGTVAISSLNVTDTFVDMGIFNGTAGNDTFTQVGVGDYTFNGGFGSNTLDLSQAPPGTPVSLGPPDPTKCSANVNNNDGTAAGNGVNDAFTCMAIVIVPSTSVYQVLPGETATVNGHGTGMLVLTCNNNNACATAGAATGVGVTVTMPTTTGGTGTVTGDGFDFAFSGMSTVVGTPYNDLFTAGAPGATFDGNGGDDGVSFAPETGGEVVNLSGSPYLVPAGLTDAGTTVAAAHAVDSNGGITTLNGISNVTGTASGNDVIVGGPGPGTLTGGSGKDTFVPTGGNDVIAGGSGASILDLSLLPSYSTFNLGSAAPQQLGAGDGTLAVVPGTIGEAIASPSGSTLQAGPGNNITLVGGQGNDWLAAGTGTQTLMAGTGNDTLVGGNGSDKLEAGASPVTFVPGQNGTDTLTSSAGNPGNTLSYAGIPFGAQVNLTALTIPAGSIASGTAVGGWGAKVTGLLGAQISTIIGSPAADTFYTGSTPVTILGNGGNDVFQINQQTIGTNVLTAGKGTASTFRFLGASNNIIDGGGNSTVDFSPYVPLPNTTPTGVTVTIPSGTATGGFGGSQSLTGIQNVIGTNYSDVLVAGAAGETLTGENGGSTQDVLEASLAGGDTLIAGGSGTHTFCAEAGCNGMGTPTAGDTMITGSGTDYFFAQNGVVDHISGQAGDTAYVDRQDILTGTGMIVVYPS